MKIPYLASCSVLLVNLGASCFADDLMKAKPAAVKSSQPAAKQSTSSKQLTTAKKSITAKQSTSAAKPAQVVIKQASYSTTSADSRKTQLQGGVQKKRKLKAGATATGTATSNPYSISQPYNPNNPPPIDNKIHPVSSNAR
jgi:hypothetical protein